jgi:hypothetical protein
MSPERAAVPYAELLSELGRLCAARRTGTMFITTTDNQSARIGLQQGDIISWSFAPSAGSRRSDRIRRTHRGTLHLLGHGGRSRRVRRPPRRPDLLSLLAGNSRAPPVAPARPLPAPPPDAAPRPGAPAQAQAAANPELVSVQTVIEAELTEFVGPIAPLLCRGHISKAAAAGSALDLPALVEAVAREIGDRAKEDRFKQQALARLREH